MSVKPVMLIKEPETCHCPVSLVCSDFPIECFISDNRANRVIGYIAFLVLSSGSLVEGGWGWGVGVQRYKVQYTRCQDRGGYFSCPLTEGDRSHYIL